MHSTDTAMNTTSFYRRRVRAMERKRTGVQKLLEYSYKLAYNDVEKILDMYFAPSFLPNWYFHSNSDEEIANHICIITQLLNAGTDYLRHVGADGKVITYFINIGRDFPGKMLTLVRENADMGIVSYDTVLTRSGIRIVTMERRGRPTLRTSEDERKEIAGVLEEVRAYGARENYRHTEEFIRSLPANYMNEEINALTYPRRVLRHLALFERAMETDTYIVNRQDTEWEVADENEKLDRREQRLAIACRRAGEYLVPEVLSRIKQDGINMNRSYYDTFPDPVSGECVSILSIYLHPLIDVSGIVADLHGVSPDSRRASVHTTQPPRESPLLSLLNRPAVASGDEARTPEKERTPETLRDLAEHPDTDGSLLGDEIRWFFAAADRNGFSPNAFALRSLLTCESTEEFWVEHAQGRERHNTPGYRVKHSAARGPHFGGIQIRPDVTASEVTASALASTWTGARTRIPFGGAFGGFRFDFAELKSDDLDYYDTLTNLGRELFLVSGPFEDVAAHHVGCGPAEIEIMFEGFKSALRDLATMAYGVKRGVGFIGSHVVSPEDARRILRDSFGIDYHDTRLLRELTASERYVELVASSQMTGKRKLGLPDHEGAIGKSLASATLTLLVHRSLEGCWEPSEPFGDEDRKILEAVASLGEEQLVAHRHEHAIAGIPWRRIEEDLWPRLVKNRRVSVIGADKIARAAVEEFSRRGARLVAICDTSGAIMGDSLSPEMIRQAKEEEGGSILAVEEGVTRRIDGSDGIFAVLEHPSDILVLAATGTAVCADAAEAVRASVVAPAAIGSVTFDGEAVLRERGVSVLYDGLVGSGSHIAGYFEWLRNLADRARYEAEIIRGSEFDPATLQHYIMPEFDTRIKSILGRSESPETAEEWRSIMRDIVCAAAGEDYRNARAEQVSMKTAGLMNAQLRVLAAELSQLEISEQDRIRAELSREPSDALDGFNTHPEVDSVTRPTARTSKFGRLRMNTVSFG